MGVIRSLSEVQCAEWSYSPVKVARELSRKKLGLGIALSEPINASHLTWKPIETPVRENKTPRPSLQRDRHVDGGAGSRTRSINALEDRSLSQW